MQSFTDRIELALENYRELFVDKKSDTESDYQSWLEKHPVIFEVLQFDEILARPKLYYSNPEFENRVFEEPDFLLKSINNEWIIFEIKTPLCKITKTSSEKRNHFYSEFNSYITQVIDYQGYFSGTENRINANERYGKNFSKKPKVIILAGLSDSLDRELARNLLPGDFSIITFDELIKKLVFICQRGFNTNYFKKGLTIAINVFIKENITDSCIFEIGDHPERNKISLWVKKSKALFFKIIDDQEDEIIIPVKDHLSFLNKWILVTVDLKINNNQAFIRIDVDGDKKGFSEYDFIQFTLDKPINLVLGSDNKMTSFSEFLFKTMFIFEKPLSFGEKNGLVEIFKKPSSSKNLYLRFDKSTMFTSKHPLFLNGDNQENNMDLI